MSDWIFRVNENVRRHYFEENCREFADCIGGDQRQLNWTSQHVEWKENGENWPILDLAANNSFFFTKEIAFY